MIAAIPVAWKVAGMAILLVVLGAIGVGLYVKGRSDGSAACEASVAQAVAAAQNDDRERSAKLFTGQAAALLALHNQSTAAQQKVANAPVTDTCGTVMRDASGGVRDLIRGGSPAP